jgi:hypothetical protein
MAYLGKGPEQVLSGVASKSTFTGDGSTTTFDISTDIPAGGENDIQVFVDNVRQEPGSGASYTVGVDGSGNLRRITFNTAPEASQSIYVINPRRIEAVSAVADNTIATAKLQDSAVTTAKINADAIDATKIADDSISDEHLDVTSITGQTELAEVANDSDVFLIYDASAGTLKKVLRSNIVIEVPTVSSVSPTNITSGDGTGNATFTITGTKFDASATAKLITTGGAEVDFDTVTRDSSTQITAVIAISSLSNANEPYDVKVINSSGLTSTLTDQINIDAQPVFNTSAGSLGSVSDLSRDVTTLTIEAYDPESAGNVTFEIQSGSLPAGATATTVNENGVSKYQISGFSAVVGNTTSNFTIRAADTNSNTSSRAFSITVNAPVSESFTSSGTFSVPSGTTAVDVLVIAGGGGGGCAAPGGGARRAGGGGGGGLVFVPGFPVTPGGTVSVTVGCGGAGATGKGGQNGTPGQDSTFGTLIAKGGGGAGGAYGCVENGEPGGSGGGGSSGTVVPVNTSGGSATQPTQPGQSGAYGFGNAGGPGQASSTSPAGGAGGGGGAGAAGSGGTCSPLHSRGGAGKSYTIADGTTPVGYAGGGGGATALANCQPWHGAGQDGGGPAAAVASNPGYPGGSGVPGTANRGGGGGGADEPACNTGGSGGKGIVIVRY